MLLSDFLSIFLLCSVPTIRAAVLAIDYGAEFTKLSLVKPGVPFDVVLDRDSKRKIQSVVGWKRDDRVFGQEGKMAATRFPDTHFPYIKPLLGSTRIPSPELYPNPPTISSEGAIIFPHPNHPSHLSPSPASDDEVWTPTALLAHQISYFRNLAESLHPAGQTAETVTQVIVTVPAWWNQYQRKAYRDALELQGLTCLAMIGEGTGVALNYAMTRIFPTVDLVTGEGEKEYHLIYDSGALSTTASIVAFYQTSELPSPKAKTPINTTYIDVLGTGYEHVGGVTLDLMMRDLLTEDFVKKSGLAGVKNDRRAMAKLGGEAIRVKQILSANQESNVNIESLFDDVDYRSKLSRSDLEAVLGTSDQLFVTPITSALANTDLTLPDLTSIILFGGNTRVPFVQTSIRSILGEEVANKIAQNVNTDEAAVLGAAYYGAGLSRQFKMKSIEVIERSVDAFRLESGEGPVIYAKGHRLGEKKVLSLPARDTELEFYQGDTPILNVQLVEVDQLLANFTAAESIINLTMRLDARGHLAVANAVLVSNVTEIDSSSGGVAGALKGLFGKKDKDAEEDEVDIENTVKDDKKEKKEMKRKEARVPVKFRERHLGVKPMTGEDKRTTMQRLTSVSTHEAAKTARENARNMLEGYLYRLQGYLKPEADNRALLDYSTATERETLSKLLGETFGWLSEHAETAEEQALLSKRSALEVIEYPIVVRFSESRTRTKAIEAFQQAMFAARAFFVEAHKNNTEAIESASAATPENPVAPPKYTEDELKGVEDLLKENEIWMDERMEKQVKIEDDKTKDPEIYTKDLDEKGKTIQMVVLRLVNKKAPKAPRPKTRSTSSSSTSTVASSSDETGSSQTLSSTSSSSSPPTSETTYIHEEL